MSRNSSFRVLYDKYQVWIHCLLVVIVAVVLCWLSMLFMDFWTNHGKVEVVPNVVGLNYMNAQDILDAKDFVQQELNKPLSPEYPDGYLFVTMGAGDNWKLGKAILA